MSETILITSNDELDDIDLHFRVFAGPGAGKTYWLKKHLVNVIKNTDKLNSVSKIACITYTLVASDKVKEGLGKCADKVEVSTIHSFLYKNIVKPYAFLLMDDDSTNLINLSKLAGHDEHIPSFGKIKAWIKECNLYYLMKYCNDKELRDCLSNLTWGFNSDLSELKLVMRNYHVYNSKLKNKCGYSFPMKNALDYKMKYWQEGQIHHEDVLYFSHKILFENPTISIFLKYKFPCIFLDEFQDTSPIQTQIIKMLANQGCIVGIIGDAAQSIYKFQGAERKDFLEFELEGLIDYKIEGNRRSTANIINLLNHMRKEDEVQQTCFRNEMGTEVKLIVCDQLPNIIKIISEDLSYIGFDGEHCTLARDNKSVAFLKSRLESYKNTIWEEFESIDYERKKFYYTLCVAIEYAFQKRYDLASKQLMRIFSTDSNGNLKYYIKGTINNNLFQKEGIVIQFLQKILESRAVMLKSNLYEINNNILPPFLRAFNMELPRLKSGKRKDFCESITYENLIQNLKLDEDNSFIRTIHKAKGAEFDSVHVSLSNENDLNCILKPNLEENEEHRILYVAFSRAINHLYISIPSLSSINEINLKNLDLNIKIIRQTVS